MTSAIDLGHFVSGDVIDLVLADHVRFESLMRQLRDTTADRDAVRHAFAELHVAHARAEEEIVYPRLRRKRAITGHEQEHGEEEHAEGNELIAAGSIQVTRVLAERRDGLEQLLVTFPRLLAAVHRRLSAGLPATLTQ